LHEHDLVEDSVGRRGTRPTQAKRSALGGETAKRHRAEEFAAAVCEHAAHQLRAARADRLYLVAEPEFLGLLRRSLDRSVLRQVAGAVPKSVTAKAPGRIRATLPSRL
jgi:protein required for attachment to host cells